jgi:hypothetical protein
MHYYVTDNPVGKVYTVNADGTGYETLIDLQRQTRDCRPRVHTSSKYDYNTYYPR